MDEKDVYPTDEELQFIREFDVLKNGYAPLFEYVRNLWWLGYGWEEYVRTDDYESSDGLACVPYKHNYRVVMMSTGGWSGNESIIKALRENPHFWYCCEMERKGGHYVFEVEEKSWKR